MSVLITGGTGLVGSRLLRHLTARGVACRALVRADGELPDGVQRVAGDVLAPETLASAVDGVDAVVHLAAVFRTHDEELIWRVNLDGTRNLVSAVQEHAPHARFVMASTSNVYGPELTHPGREDDPTTASHAYPASKLAAEELLRGTGLNWTVLRFPFIYGDQDGHLEASIPQFVAMDWHPARRLSVLHHHDVATAVEFALSGAADRRVLNIADDAPITVQQIAQIVSAEYPQTDAPLPGPWMGQMDTALARSLGFAPRVRTVFQAMEESLL